MIVQNVSKVRRNSAPSFFRRMMVMATWQNEDYFEHAGYQLGFAMMQLVEYDNEEERQQIMDEYIDIAVANDDSALVEWLKRNFPVCMELVPEDRISVFIKAFRQGHDDYPADEIFY